MPLPPPEPGLVISYAYLWASERDRGREQGRKDRPCAIVLTRQPVAGAEWVTVVPVTRAAPREGQAAVEMPPQIAQHLGLDTGPHWVVVTEVNDFLWPGPDLRPVSPDRPDVFDYGFLPPSFFERIKDALLCELQARRGGVVRRTD